MKMKLATNFSFSATVLSLLATPAPAVDLLAHYPTQMTAGDAGPDHARPWEFDPGDIAFHIDIGSISDRLWA